MRSAGPAKITVCSPTTLPPRKVAKPIWPCLARAGMAVAAAHGMLVEIEPRAFGRRLAEQQRGARRRIDLVVVMHFEDLDIEILAERLGRALRTSAASRLTPRLILPDFTITARCARRC